MGVFKSSGDRHRSKPSVGSVASSSSSSSAPPARDGPAAALVTPKSVNSLVTWEKQNEQRRQQQQQQQQQQRAVISERSGYAHAGTDWEARNGGKADEAQGEAPKKTHWTKRLFKGPGLGVYG